MLATVWAAYAAAKAAQSADRAVRATEESTRLERRAYVCAEGAIFLKSDDGQPTNNIVLTIKNNGTTPSIDTMDWANVIIDKFPLDRDIQTNQFGVMHPRSVLSPSASIVYPLYLPQEAPEDDIMKVSNGEYAIYVYGGIEYKDIFGETHSTRFCFRCIGASELSLGAFKAYPTGNTMD